MLQEGVSLAAGPGMKFAPDMLPSGEIAWIRKDTANAGIFYGQGKPGPKGVGLLFASWSPDGARVVYDRFAPKGPEFGAKLWSRDPKYELHFTAILPWKKYGCSYG
jgi:hypothetical protein